MWGSLPSSHCPPSSAQRPGMVPAAVNVGEAIQNPEGHSRFLGAWRPHDVRVEAGLPHRSASGPAVGHCRHADHGCVCGEGGRGALNKKKKRNLSNSKWEGHSPIPRLSLPLFVTFLR